MKAERSQAVPIQKLEWIAHALNAPIESLLSQPERQKRMVDSFFNEFLSKGRMEILPNLCAYDVVCHDTAVSDRIVGVSQLTGYAQTIRAAFPDLQYNMISTVSEADQAAAHWAATGTHQAEFLGISPTQTPVELKGITLFAFRTELIRDIWQSTNIVYLKSLLAS